MSTMAAPPVSATNPPEVTWRDAVTPLSRASRQRWTACYALLLIALAATVAEPDTFTVGEDGDHVIPFVLLVALPVVFGMLRRGTRRIAALDHPDLDERDVAARNRAYRVALPLLMLVVLAALVLLAVAAPDIERSIRVGPDEHSTTSGFFVEPRAVLGVGLWIALWAVFLPTGVLAWSEPDAVEDETHGTALSEPLRDALLGLALAGGIALDVVTDVQAGFVLFAVVLALLGGLARRASGQPMMSRQRKWRIAIGIVLILIVTGVAIIGLSSGSTGDGGIVDEPPPAR